MVAQQHEVGSRHNALLEAGQEIARLNGEIETLTIQRNAHSLRAQRAEEVVRQLEAQITHPAQETITLVQELLPSDVRLKADRELAEYINANWVVASEIVNTIESVNGKLPMSVQHYRIVRFIRTAPIEPATDQPPATVTVAAAATNSDAAATPAPEPVYPADPADFPPAHSSISGLWNALYQMDRVAELVQHWPRLTEYAPRVYAVFADAGCDMADVVMMKSFRPGRGDDQRTMKIIFRSSSQIVPGTRTAMTAAGLERVIARDGREFIFDLPESWVSAPRRKTVKADAVLDASVTPDVSVNGHDRNFGQIATDRANLNAMVTDLEITHEAFHKALINSRLPHDEQEALLMQSRQLRVGGRIAAQTAHIPSYQSRPLNSFLTGTK